MKDSTTRRDAPLIAAPGRSIAAHVLHSGPGRPSRASAAAAEGRGAGGLIRLLLKWSLAAREAEGDAAGGGRPRTLAPADALGYSEDVKDAVRGLDVARGGAASRCSGNICGLVKERDYARLFWLGARLPLPLSWL